MTDRMLEPEERASITEYNRRQRAQTRMHDILVLAVAGIACIWIGFLAIGWLL